MPVNADRAHDLYQLIKDQGEAALDNFIAQKVTEELFLDFKQAAKDGKGTALAGDDRKNYSRAISGFGNSEGGVVVWGVKCRKNDDGADVPYEKMPIEHPIRFKAWLEDATSGLTVPPHRTVQHHAIVRESGNSGFVVTLIPMSNLAPHQLSDGKYLMRAGSSFFPVPHAVLAGMFGRRPQAEIVNSWIRDPLVIADDGAAVCRVQVSLMNRGRGIAEHMYLNLRVQSSPGQNCTLRFDDFKSKQWEGSFPFDSILSAMAMDGIRLAPMARLSPVTLLLVLKPPFVRPLHIEGECGSSNSPPTSMVVEVSANALSAAYAALGAQPSEAAINTFWELLFPARQVPLV